MAKHKTQLNYLNVLMGNEPEIDDIIESLDRKLTYLVNQEQVILGHFTTLTRLNEELETAGARLLRASEDLSEKIISEISNATWLNRMFSWGLLITIVGGLGILGAMLAKDIIHFVEDLKESREDFKTSENNLKVTLDSIGDAVITTDAGSRITE